MTKKLPVLFLTFTLQRTFDLASLSLRRLTFFSLLLHLFEYARVIIISQKYTYECSNICFLCQNKTIHIDWNLQTFLFNAIQIPHDKYGEQVREIYTLYWEHVLFSFSVYFSVRFSLFFFEWHGTSAHNYSAGYNFRLCT